MRKITKMGASLLAVGAGMAVATSDAAEHGSAGLTATAGILTGACTALGVTTLVIGWATRRPDEQSEEV